MRNLRPTPLPEQLPNVPQLCDSCWHPIGYGQMSWRCIASYPAAMYVYWHTACLPGRGET